LDLLAVDRMAVDGCDFLAVSGELDVATAPGLIGPLNDVITDGGNPLVVDLSAVSFMDSTGLALLIDAERRLSGRGRGFAVVCPPGTLMRVFVLTDMAGRLGVQPDRLAALRALND
jgi:anti-sigma B factor antagonist